jgi:signal transduction histidine kinase
MIMKKRVQLILSLLAFTIILLATLLLSTFTYRHMLAELSRQAVEDNKAMGQQVLKMFAGEAREKAAQKGDVEYFQALCDNIKLPNGGFICAASEKGEIVAIPGLKDGDKRMNISNANFSEIDGKISYTHKDVLESSEFQGVFKHMNRVDIVARMPVKGTDLFLQVHQNQEFMQKKVTALSRPMLYIGTLLAVCLAIVTYLAANMIIQRYESRLEVINAELLTTNHSLEQKHREKKELVHILCHDLSNPLTYITMGAALIDAQIEQAGLEVDEMHRSISKGIIHCNDIIGLVRKIEAIEDNKLELKLSAIDLAKAVAVSKELLQNRFDEKEVILKTEIEPSLTVYAERASLVNSVLNNLLSNAVKFSHPKGAVSVKAIKKGAGVEVTISDNGVGMPEELCSSLFCATKATTRTGTNGEEGTGFGMSLVKKFINYYGGTISVNSVEKSGSSTDHGTQITLHLKTIA